MLKYSSHQLTRVEHQLKPEVAHFEHTQVGLGIAHLETEPVLFGSLFLWKRKFSTRELEQGDCQQVTSINKPEGSCQRQMKQDATLIRARSKTPRAAIAGILFSVLLITGLLLFRLSVRADPLKTGAWLKTSAN